MIRGIQSAASGMIAQMAGQDAAANNLANANTAGYKRDVASFGAALSGAMGAASTARVEQTSAADMAQGSLQETGNALNVGLEGPGFFAVETANGVAYTRNGGFTLSPEGYLTAPGGGRVLGESGPIRLQNGGCSIDERGEITQAGARVDTLRVVRFAPNAALTKVGASLWMSNAAPAAAAARVRQGYVEGSNVTAVSEMVSMIASLRAFEAGQKAIQAQDETLQKLTNEVGRVG